MASSRIKGLTIELGGDTTGLDKALKNVNDKIKTTQSQLKDVNKLLKLDPGNTELLAQKQRLLTEAITATKDKLETLKEAAKQANEQLAKGEISKEQYEAIQREIVSTESELRKLQDEASNTGKSFKSLDEKVGDFADGMESVGKKLSVVSAGIAAVGAASVKAAMDLDEGYDTIIAKTGATGEKLEELQGIADNIFSTMPVEMADVGAAVGEVNTRFGITGDYLEEVSTQFLKFAELNQTDVSSSIDTVQKAMASFGLSSEEASYVLDVLNKAGQDTGISMDQLSSSLTSNASTMKEMGLGFEESVYFLSQLEVSGMDASQVLTGLKMAMKNAAKDGKSLDEALADLDKEMKSAKNSQEAMNSAIELFGSKAGPQLAVAIQDGTLSFSDLTKAIGEDDKALGNLSKTYEATLDPWDQATVATNNLKEAGASLASSLLEVLTPIIDDVVEIIKTLTSWFGNLSPSIKKIIVIVGGIVAAIGPFLVIFAKVIGMVQTILPIIISVVGFITGTVIPVIGTVVAAINWPIVAIAALVAAVVAAIVVIVKNWDKIKEKTIELWKKLTEIFGKIKDAVVNKITSMNDAVRNKFTSLINSAKTWGKDMIDGFVNGIKEKIQSVKNAATNIAESIKSILHFSRPDEGPLRDYEKWMPDMISGMVKGINDNKYKLTDAMNGLASDMSISPNVGIKTSLNSINTLLGQGNVIVLDTGELVGATAKSYNAEFGKLARLEAMR